MPMDGRSLRAVLIGGLLGASVFAALRPPGVAHAQGTTVAAPSGTQGGRFQIIFNPSGVRADTFLLDTQTGQVWRPTRYTDLKGEPTAWVYEYRLDSPAQISAFARSYEK